VVESVSLVEELSAGGAVGAGSDLLGPGGAAVEGFEVDQGAGAGPGRDGVEVGIDGVGELLGGGSGEAGAEVFVDRVDLLVRWDQPSVVALRVEFSAQGGVFGVGEHDLVGSAPAGELDVGGLAGEGVGADGDGEVPGAALGAVGGECVGVGEVAASVQVGVVERDVGAVVECDPHAVEPTAVMVPVWPFATGSDPWSRWWLRRRTTRSPTRTSRLP
jgi:hypothetical protein